MDKLIGYFANHPEGLRAALAVDGDGLRAPGAPRIHGWSLVSTFRGEPLVRSRPNEPRAIDDVRELFDGVRTDSALVALREGPAGADGVDEGGPFRFGWWSGVVIGAHGRGPDVRAGVLARSSDFLARLSGPRSAGHGVFALFLSRVHAAIGMDDGLVERAVLERALRETQDVWREECDRAGEPAGRLVIGVAHREFMAVSSRGCCLRTVRRNGMRDRATLERLRGRELGKLDPERLRYVWLVSGASGEPVLAPWTSHEGAEAVTVSVDRACEVRGSDW
jgi:hypothetical protein